MKLYGRISLYLIGCMLFSIGAKFFINSKLGVDPLDSLVLGLAAHLKFKIGTTSAIIAIFFLCIWSIWNKCKPIITPFVTMTLVGYLIDLWNYLIPKPDFITFSQSMPIMLVGLLLCAYASSLIIMSGIGIRTMDLVAITMTNKLKLQFFISKAMLETCFVISGYLLGGPLGIGTIAFLVLVGPLIQPLMYFNNKIFNLTNYGIGKNAALI